MKITDLKAFLGEAHEDHKVETIDYNRLDNHDLKNLIFKAIVISAFGELQRKADRHERTEDKDDPDYQAFDMSIDAVSEEADDYLQALIDLLEERSYKEITAIVKEVYPDLKPRVK